MGVRSGNQTGGVDASIICVGATGRGGYWRWELSSLYFVMFLNKRIIKYLQDKNKTRKTCCVITWLVSRLKTAPPPFEQKTNMPAKTKNRKSDHQNCPFWSDKFTIFYKKKPAKVWTGLRQGGWDGIEGGTNSVYTINVSIIQGVFFTGHPLKFISMELVTPQHQKWSPKIN